MKRISLAVVGILLVVGLLSGVANAGDRVGTIVVKDRHIRGICLIPINWNCPIPDPGVVRGIVDLVGEEDARALGVRKRPLTRRTYHFPVVTNDEVCARAKAWAREYRRAGRPKLWNWDREMEFEVAPALVAELTADGRSYYKGIDGIFVGDREQPAVGNRLVLSVRPDLVKSVRGLCD